MSYLSAPLVKGGRLRDILGGLFDKIDPHEPRYSDATIEETCERAAIIEHDGGKDRWHACIDAQRQHLGVVETTAADL
jgi:hypothetical protein